MATRRLTKREKVKQRKQLHAIGHELKHNEPRIVGHTRGKFGCEVAKKQKVAILLSKARRSGVKGIKKWPPKKRK